MKLFDSTFCGIEKCLDLYYKRHIVLSGNVVNSETPKYQAREVDFSGELEKAFGSDEEQLAKTSSKHMDVRPEGGAHVVMDNSTPVGADGNNVDLDIAMGKLSSNARQYTKAAQLLLVKLRVMRTAAMGRGGI